MAVTSLAAKVNTRVNAQLLKELTNPNAPAATTVNETILQAAGDDCEAEYKIYANIDYDDTDARHVSVGVEGVVAKLRQWMGQTDKADEMVDKWRRGALKDLARVTGRDRVVPTTTSPVIDSSELNPDGSAPRSRFDRSRFVPTRPGVPGGGSGEDDDLPE